MRTDCPVIGCEGEPHSCDPIERHAFDPPEETGARLNAWLAPMEFGATQSWVWLAFTQMQIDASQGVTR